MNKLSILHGKIRELRKKRIPLKVIPLLSDTLKRSQLKGNSIEALNTLILWQDILKNDIVIDRSCKISIKEIAETDEDVNLMIETIAQLTKCPKEGKEDVDIEDINAETENDGQLIIVSMLRQEWNNIIFKESELLVDKSQISKDSAIGLLLSYDYLASIMIDKQMKTSLKETKTYNDKNHEDMNIITTTNIMTIINNSFIKGNIIVNEKQLEKDIKVIDVKDTYTLYKSYDEFCKAKGIAPLSKIYLKCDKYILSEALNSVDYKNKKAFIESSEIVTGPNNVYIPVESGGYIYENEEQEHK